MSDRCIICGNPLRIRNRKTCGKIECKSLYQKQNYQKRYQKQYQKRREQKQQDGRETVSCAVCGEKFEVIRSTHLRKHQLTMEQYTQLFPGWPLLTNRIRDIRSNAPKSRSLYLGSSVKEPDSLLFEFLTGSLLGDGSLEAKHRRANARYAEGGKNELYLKWKFDFLSQYFPCSFTQRLSSPHRKSGKRYQGWWIRTTVHPVLTQWHLHWYVDRKVIPYILIPQYLTDFALAVWFCDDGFMGRSDALLHTQAFSDDEVGFLAEILYTQFGFCPNVRKNSTNQPFLFFHAQDSRRLRELIAPFGIPGMEYKYRSK